MPFRQVNDSHIYCEAFLLLLCCSAEAIRKAGEPEWFQLVGLLHDMGKIMFLWGNAVDGQEVGVLF